MTINGSVTRPTESMTERDSINAFCDGARKAISAARELAKDTDNPDWIIVATTLEAMAQGGKQLFDMKAMSRLETLMAANMKAAPYKPH